MHLKQFVIISLALVFIPVFATAVWASTEKAPTESSAATVTESVETPEKPEEEISFCSPNLLLKSEFVRTSVWPGIGPFDIITDKTADVSSSKNSIKLGDPSHNYLTCSTTGNQINSCELELHNSIGEAQGLLNLQMGADFLLEGLGVKASQIHIVNMELGKKSKLLTGNNYNPVSIIIAPLTVSFQNLGKKEGTSNPLFRVVILNQPKLSEQTTSQKELSSTAKPDDNQAGEIESTNPSEPNKSVATHVETAESQSEDSEPKSQLPSVGTETAQIKNTPVKKLSKDEQLKKEFLDVIINWQRIKKTAVHQHQTNELSQALAGKALAKQSDAIKWLASNHKHYEMLSQGATIEHFDSLVPEKKYAVFAEVKEKSKYIDETTKQQLKETDDTYKVNYTIEKIGPHWLITDSALIKEGTKKPGPAKSRH